MKVFSFFLKLCFLFLLSGELGCKSLPIRNRIADNAITPDFSDNQAYLFDAPNGVNAKYAWDIPGGKGDGVKIIVVERPVDIAHEDFKKPFWIGGKEVDSYGDKDGDHGTSVVGELIAKHNEFGVNGICPNADFGISPINQDDDIEVAIAKAIDSAAAHLQIGDIILIERFLWDPLNRVPSDSSCNTKLYGTLPVEYDQKCFDAIKRATSKGIIVIEPAVNGGINLDDSVYNNLFNRRFRDSKALMIAADEGGNGIPACWTNYGSRIDFFAWGDNIVTTGDGDLFQTLGNVHTKYTKKFQGTSGAAPIIAGVVACLQGIQLKLGRKPLTVNQIRDQVIGPRQTAGSKFIGVMPDLKATIENLIKK